MTMKLFRLTSQVCVAVSLMILGLWVTGCGSTSGGQNSQFSPVPGLDAGANPVVTGPATREFMRIGDTVTVKFSEIDPAPADHVERIKEDGTVTLPLIGAVIAAGKTTGQLQKEIHDRYVPKFYTAITIVVIAQDQYVYVGGEVKQPGRILIIGSDMTLLRAIQTAGDFTDFAKKSKVQLTHAGGRVETVNIYKVIRDPSLDPPVYPGDRIYVPRRIL